MQAEHFAEFPVADGVHLHVLPTDKFKTTVVYVYFHVPMTPETVTNNALLPMVLARGSADYPSTAELARHLDELYGAAFGVDVGRRGEVQSIVFRIEAPNEQHIPGESGLMERAMATLAGVITRPLLEGDGFKPDYFAQETKNLRHLIEGLINDKRRYAMVRCTAAMCEGEPFALYRLGRVEDLDHISAQSLKQYHDQVLSTAPVDIFVIGDIQPEAARDMVQRNLKLPQGARKMPRTTVKREPGHPPKEVVDRLDVNQGVLVLGLRTGATITDDDYFPLLVANGVLGGFPHSKLFQNVREQNSLAYFAYSTVESVKGVGFMYAGIEFENRQRCQEIMLEQLKALQNGEIDDDEFATTILTISNDMLSAADQPGAMADLAVDRVFSGRNLSIEERIAAFEAVTKEQVAAAARKFQVDTIYFLDKKGGQ